MADTSGAILRKVKDDQGKYYTDPFLWKLWFAGGAISVVLGIVAYMIQSNACDAAPCPATRRSSECDRQRTCVQQARTFGFAVCVLGVIVSGVVNEWYALKRGHFSALAEQWVARKLFDT